MISLERCCFKWASISSSEAAGQPCSSKPDARLRGSRSPKASVSAYFLASRPRPWRVIAFRAGDLARVQKHAVTAQLARGADRPDEGGLHFDHRVDLPVLEGRMHGSGRQPSRLIPNAPSSLLPTRVRKRAPAVRSSLARGPRRCCSSLSARKVSPRPARAGRAQRGLRSGSASPRDRGQRPRRPRCSRARDGAGGAS